LRRSNQSMEDDLPGIGWEGQTLPRLIG